jgi:hypothetical protein
VAVVDTESHATPVRQTAAEGPVVDMIVARAFSVDGVYRANALLAAAAHDAPESRRRVLT